MILSRRPTPCLPRQLLEPRDATEIGRDLRAQVAAPLLRGAHIGEDDGFHVRVGDARAGQPHRRQPQALAVDLGRGAVGAGGIAADVGPVGAHAGEAQQGVLVEGGHDHVDVGEMAPAEVGIVVDEDVAGLEGGEGADDRLHRQRHGAEMNGQIGPLRDHLAGHVEEAAGVVARHLEQRRVGGLGQHHLHLLGGAVERVLHDLERRGIGGGQRGHRLVSGGVWVRRMKPPSSTRQYQPGGTTTVVSMASMTSGPGAARARRQRLARQHVAADEARLLEVGLARAHGARRGARIGPPRELEARLMPHRGQAQVHALHRFVGARVAIGLAMAVVEVGGQAREGLRPSRRPGATGTVSS